MTTKTAKDVFPESSSSTEELRAKSENGDTRAMQQLSFRLRCWNANKEEKAESVRWLTRAAQLGDCIALRELAVLYEQGRGVEKSIKSARQLYRRAAELGEAQSMIQLGAMYAFGVGVAKCEATAFDWFMRAAKKPFVFSPIASRMASASPRTRPLRFNGIAAPISSATRMPHSKSAASSPRVAAMSHAIRSRRSTPFDAPPTKATVMQCSRLQSAMKPATVWRATRRRWWSGCVAPPTQAICVPPCSSLPPTTTGAVSRRISRLHSCVSARRRTRRL